MIDPWIAQFDPFRGFLTLARGDGGVVDQHVQRAAPALGQGLDLGPAGDIGQFIAEVGISRGPPDAIRGGLGFGLIASQQHHPMVGGLGQLVGDGLADGSGRPGDQKTRRIGA